MKKLSPFSQTLSAVIVEREVSLSEAARQIGISKGCLHDLTNDNRLPSVRITNLICDWLGMTKQRRVEWHRMAAARHRWEVE